MDSPTSGPNGLNIHAHSEQPQPQKCCSLIHISLRRIGSMATSRFGAVMLLLKDGVALAFDRTATTKTPVLIAPSEVLPKSLLFGTHQTEVDIQGRNISDRKRSLSVGYPTLTGKLLSQPEFILELLNDAVTLTRGGLEFPAVHNLHYTPHVFYDSLFLQD